MMMKKNETYSTLESYLCVPIAHVIVFQLINQTAYSEWSWVEISSPSPVVCMIVSREEITLKSKIYCYVECFRCCALDDACDGLT